MVDRLGRGWGSGWAGVGGLGGAMGVKDLIDPEVGEGGGGFGTHEGFYLI